MHALPYLIGFLVPLTVFIGASLGGWFAFATPFVFFVITPIVDELVPRATTNADMEEERRRTENPAYSWIVRAWFPVQLAAMVFALWQIMNGELGWIESAGIILSVGILGGTGINVAHELMHRTNKFGTARTPAHTLWNR